MRIAILSDIHGNIRGLDACLADLEAQGGADVVVGAGDFCTDGPRPREVLERLVAINALCLRGNKDRELSGPARPDLETFVAEDDPAEGESLSWQRSQLGESWLSFLRDLPFARRFGEGSDGLLVVHANPKHDDVHIWPDAEDAFLEHVVEGVAERAIAFGHLHLPYVRVWRDRMLVNVASAGLPKDGDPRACYAIFTQRAGGWQVKHRRVAFNVEMVIEDIEKSGMPDRRRRIDVLRRARYEELVDVIP